MKSKLMLLGCFFSSLAFSATVVKGVPECSINKSDGKYVNTINQRKTLIYAPNGNWTKAQFVNSLDLQEIKYHQLIDCSSQFRLDPTWCYHALSIFNHYPIVFHKQATQHRIVQAGCFASGMHLLFEPIADYITHSHLHVTGITGYSAGGYDCTAKQTKLSAMNRLHSHSVEVSHHLMLEHNVHFTPIISADTERGQIVSTIIPNDVLSFELIVSSFEAMYKDTSIKLKISESNIYSSSYLADNADTSNIDVYITKKEGETQIVANYDNITICADSVIDIIKENKK